MDEAWQQRVRERAYAIWQEVGSPDGSADQFWLMAEEELLAEGQTPLSALQDDAADRAEAAVDRALGDSSPASGTPG